MILRELFSKIVVDVKAAVDNVNRFDASMDEASEGLAKTEKEAKGLGKRLDDTGKRSRKFGQGLASAFQKAGKAAFNARGQIKDAGIGIGKSFAVITAGAAGAVTVAGALTLKWAEQAQELDNLSRQYSLSTDDIQAFTGALSLMGLEADDGLEAIKELRIRLGEAKKEGTSPLREALIDLGINFDRFDALPLLDQMGLLADRFSEVEEASRRTALANDVAGDDLIKLLPIMDLQADGLKKVLKEARALNLVQSKESIAAGKALAKSWKALNAIFKSVADLVARRLEPTFSSIIKTTREWLDVNREFVTGRLVDFIERLVNVSADFLPVAVQFIDALLKIVEGLGGVDGAIIAVLGTMVTWKASTLSLFAIGGPWLGGIAAVTTALILFGKRVDAEDRRISRLAKRRLGGRGFKRRDLTTEELEAGGEPVAEILRLEGQRAALLERSKALGVGKDIEAFRQRELARLKAAITPATPIVPEDIAAIATTVREFKSLENQIADLEKAIREQVSFLNDDAREAKKETRSAKAAEKTVRDEEDRKLRARARELTELLRREKLTPAGQAELLGITAILSIDQPEGLFEGEIEKARRTGGAKKKKKKEPTIEELVGLGPKGIKTISDLVPKGQGTTINNFSFSTRVEAPKVTINITTPDGTSPAAVAQNINERLGRVITDIANQDQRELVGQLQG